MNRILKQQLLKVNIPLPEWNDNTTHMIISRDYSVKKKSEFTIGASYDIIIEDYIVNEPSNFTLSSNWNGGTKPPEHCMIVTIKQIMGKMIKVSGVGKTSGTYWEGWLPQKGMKVS